MAKSLGKVTIAEGQEWEKVIEVPYPKGKKWRKLAPKLMAFVLGFSEEGSGEEAEVSASDLIGAINGLWNTNEFEEVYVPAVFGLEDAKGRKYLDEECVMMDIVTPFFEAASMIMEASMGRQDTQAALGKSQDGKAEKT